MQDKPAVPRDAGNLTPMQECFAQAYVRLNDASKAYREAYPEQSANSKPESINRNAHELSKHHAGIVARINQLREDGTCTVASLSRDLQEDRRLARSLGQCGPAIAATGMRAKLHGHIDSNKTDAAGVLTALAGLVQQLDARHQDTPPMPEPPAISSTCERIEE